MTCFGSTSSQATRWCGRFPSRVENLCILSSRSLSFFSFSFFSDRGCVFSHLGTTAVAVTRTPARDPPGTGKNRTRRRTRASQQAGASSTPTLTATAARMSITLRSRSTISLTPLSRPHAVCKTSRATTTRWTATCQIRPRRTTRHASGAQAAALSRACANTSASSIIGEENHPPSPTFSLPLHRQPGPVESGAATLWYANPLLPSDSLSPCKCLETGQLKTPPKADTKPGRAGPNQPEEVNKLCAYACARRICPKVACISHNKPSDICKAKPTSPASWDISGGAGLVDNYIMSFGNGI